MENAASNLQEADVIDRPKNNDASNSAVPSPPRWKGVRSLALVQQLNERCLELLSQVATSKDCHCPLEILHLHRELWRGLDATARRRAARLPFVMVDIRFTDIAWWQQVREPTSNDAFDARNTAQLPQNIAEQLVHETLMFAWHAAQSDPRIACLTIGMSSEVSAVIAGMTAREIRDVASKHGGEVAPRWRESPELWKRLLLAAQRGDEAALADVQLHANLLLSGELLATCK
jgi:hypothetical protein